MNDEFDKAWQWVNAHMPREATDALLKFTSINPHWRGAHWEDCLEVLVDSDSHLDITEPLHEDERLESYPSRLVECIAQTLIYASKPFSVDYDDDMRVAAVKATIDNNGGGW
jgi:hypothetical protein